MALRRPHKGMKMGWRVSFFHRLVALPLRTPSGFRPSPETPMALRRPHKGMKMGRRRAVQLGR